ncbi:2-polyprenyl-6-methoxyphenol hydroxylase-like FAD-dependent oxidoreductase [Actinoplanes tereljensis]|uniref:FAD-binding monooxygenase n=1 Tax=Paractinoplanes tereljensis TaxID=571912 RepID=A0A919TRC3_9ACTN|nr:FAD-dependent monooxygenase [Actinoplanes tereljensis]GIF19069.1 FAD-binding monooxygenase [Actinoplanes tereljensis]
MDDRAIVIGASIAGLAAARVLSRRYAQVLVLDRDTLPFSASPRRGVPQGLHPHVLLVAGLRELSVLFPGLERELIALGGTPIDAGSEMCNYRFGRRWPAVGTGLATISVSRPQLEAVLRARAGALPGVTIRDQVAVSGLAGRSDAVNGVVLDTGETLPASLVVDCSGRGSRSDRWLGSLGLNPPPEIEVPVGIGYATRVYRRYPGDLGPWRAAFTQSENGFGMAVPIEGDRWLIGAGGRHLTDFLDCVDRLPDRIIPELISRTEPLSDVSVAQFPAARRRLFEKMDRAPGGYVALGDTVGSLNPLYGQGMTCAILAASTLGKVLDRHQRTADAETVRDYYATAAERLEAPWQFAAGRSPGLAVRSRYTRQVALASQVDPDIYRALLGVQHLVEPASALFRPGLAARVVRLAGKRARENDVSG